MVLYEILLKEVTTGLEDLKNMQKCLTPTVSDVMALSGMTLVLLNTVGNIQKGIHHSLLRNLSEEATEAYENMSQKTSTAFSADSMALFYSELLTRYSALHTENSAEVTRTEKELRGKIKIWDTYFKEIQEALLVLE